MRYLYMDKEGLDDFIKCLRKNYKVAAPVKKENQYVFDEVDSAAEISMDYMPTILPPKKYFSPQREKLGLFSMNEVNMDETSVDAEPMVIFAAHTCDIDGMECMDTVFHNAPQDPYYAKKKKYIFVIGYECMSPCDERATCVTMDTHMPKAGYDIMITDAGDRYILHVNSNAGNAMIGDNPVFEEAPSGKAKTELRQLRSDKSSRFKRLLEAKYTELPDIFERSYESVVWEDVGRRCVSCGNCTAVCPTCYCFDIYDDVKLDMTGGARKRVWDSCQLEEFAVVSGGENFRKERSHRQRHRYYRKFDYPVKKYNKFFCTGCGRCTRTCMAGISLIETVNDLTKERKDVQL